LRSLAQQLSDPSTSVACKYSQDGCNGSSVLMEDEGVLPPIVAYRHSMQCHTEEAEASIPTETMNTHRNDANYAAHAINDSGVLVVKRLMLLPLMLPARPRRRCIQCL
jgi:hypothetical protein